MTSIGHGLPDMMPVRSVVDRAAGERRVLQLGDVHRRHAVDRRGPLFFDRVERRAGLKILGRDDHRRAVDGAGQRAQHAAEAVIERHGNAEAVVLGELLAAADVIGVEQQIAVAEHGGFGEAGRAGGVLDVDRLLCGLSERLMRSSSLGGTLRPALDHLVPQQQAGRRVAFDGDDVAQPRIRVGLLTRPSLAAAISGQTSASIAK